jgi:hypothetical protein
MKTGNPPSESSDVILETAWKQHFDAIRVIREYLESQGGSIQIDIVIRDKTKTEEYARRKAAAKKRRRL